MFRHLKQLLGNEKGQMILLSGFIIVIGLVTYTTLLNEMIFTTNTPQTGQDLSKNDIKQLRALLVEQARVAANYALYKNATGGGDVATTYVTFMDPLVNATSAYYVAHGASVNIELNSINSTNDTASLLPTTLFVRDGMAPKTFSNKSIIIPMDYRQANIMPVYGMIWNLTNDFGIPVYQLIQDPRGEAWDSENSILNDGDADSDFDIKIKTNDTAFDDSSIGNNTVTDRDYAGGPYVIDYADLNAIDDDGETVEGRLEGFNNGTYNLTTLGNITMHRTWEEFTYDKTAAIDEAPRIGIWPPNGTYESDPDAMNLYYEHSGVQNYTLNDTVFDNTDYATQKGLYEYDIIMIPHSNMSAAYGSTDMKKLVTWVKDGGVLYVEGMGVAGMDYAAQKAKEEIGTDSLGFGYGWWYGFIGVIHSNGTGAVNPVADTNMTFIGVSTSYDTSKKYQYYNETAKNDPMADPGSAFNPLAQTYATKGNLTITSGHTQAFIIVPDEPALNEIVYAPKCGYTLGSNVTTASACYPSIETHNPNINILAVPTNNNQSYINRTTYVEAGFGDGTVIYLGSDNQTEGGEQRERLVFNTLFYSVLRERGIFAIRDINFTIRYNSGNTLYNTTIGIESMS